MSRSGEGVAFESNGLDCATVRLDPRIYSREALLRAGYWCTAIAYVQVPEPDGEHLVVQIRLKQHTPSLENPKPLGIGEVVGEFCNSLLDFELRRQVENETAHVRQLILAKAFSESGVLEELPPGSVVDPVESHTPGSLVNIITPPKPIRD